jgi:hypothetical protein
MSLPRYVKRKSLTELPAANKVSNSVSRERHYHPVSPPSLLNRLWTSVRPKGLLTVKNHAEGLKRRMTRTTPVKKTKNKPRRHISSARRHAGDADLRDVGMMTNAKDMSPDDTLTRQRMSVTRSPAITTDKCDIGWVTIDMLPKDALLMIFGSYLDDSHSEASSMNGWHTLVHVCQKWRNVVFGSPHRLNLQLRCTPWKPVKRMLDVWPPFPIVIHHFGLTASEWGMNNISTALKHNDRVCQIALRPIPGWQWEHFMAAMSHPFPELTHLRLTSDDGRETKPVAPHSLLAGSALRLRFLWLERIPFPGLPTLLLSATDLVDLRLWEVPHSGYISPETMATCFSALTRLERLDLEFESPQSRPDSESPCPPSSSSTRFVLPALTRFWFRGTSDYLEDLVAWIDAPLLHDLFIGLFHQLVFDTPQLAQFISRTPALRLHNQSQVLCFSDWGASVILRRTGTSERVLQLGILCGQSDWQLSSLAQLCNSSFPNTFIPAVEHLSILEETPSPPHWQDNIENSQWLELLHLFTAVKNLYLSKEFAPRIAPSLQKLVGERATEALPTLRKLFLEDIHPSRPAKKAIGKFIAARRLSDHPITISRWERSREGD